MFYKLYHVQMKFPIRFRPFRLECESCNPVAAHSIWWKSKISFFLSFVWYIRMKLQLNVEFSSKSFRTWSRLVVEFMLVVRVNIGLWKLYREHEHMFVDITITTQRKFRWILVVVLRNLFRWKKMHFLRKWGNKFLIEREAHTTL